MPVKLEHRAKCKTQPLLEYQAKQMMMRHVADGHGGGGVAADRVVDVEVLPEAVQRPRSCLRLYRGQGGAVWINFNPSN